MESFLDFWVRLDFWERLDFWVREADGRPAGQRLDIYSRGTYAYVSRRYAPYSKVAADPHVRSGLRPRVKAAVEEELSRKHRRSTRKALVLHRTVYQAISASRRCEVRAVADQRGPRAAVRCSSEELGHYVRATLGSTNRALNRATKSNVFPLPRCDLLTHHMARGHVHSSADLKDGFFQVLCTPRAKALSAITTPFGNELPHDAPRLARRRPGRSRRERHRGRRRRATSPVARPAAARPCGWWCVFHLSSPPPPLGRLRPYRFKGYFYQNSTKKYAAGPLSRRRERRVAHWKEREQGSRLLQSASRSAS